METKKWSLDPSHSEVGFKVKHMMFTNVNGKFQDIEASIETVDDNLENANIEFSAKVDSISTGNGDRDQHLRSSDFFDVEQYPELVFKSVSVKPSPNNGHYEMMGNLSIREIVKPVALNMEFAGVAKDPWGNERIGFVLEGKINRKDWGLNWNSALETGGVLVGEDVKLHAEVQFIKQ